MPGRSYNNMKGWGPELCARRPDIMMAMVDTSVLCSMRHQPETGRRSPADPYSDPLSLREAAV
jgi:hypothetical protein